MRDRICERSISERERERDRERERERERMVVGCEGCVYNTVPVKEGSMPVMV